MTNTCSKAVLLTSSAMLLLIPAALSAQQAPSTVPTPMTAASAQAPQSEGAMGDIIVTAQRRDESLSRTPVSVQIVGADALEKAQVRTQDDLRSVAPGLSIRSGVDANELNFAVRGQSKDPLTDTQPGVLPYFNEVPIGGGKVGASVFYDLQSVQLLKGPQGTLFGRSATGGAVLYTTAKPTNELSGNIGGSLGDYALRSVDGAINVPIVDNKVLLRVAAVYRERQGFQYNIFPGRGRVGDNQRYGGRASLAVNLGGFHNELVVDYLHTNGTPLNPVITGLIPFTGVGAPFVPATFLYAGVATPTARATGIATISAFTGGVIPPATVAAYYDAYFAPGTGHTAGGLTQELADQRARGPYVIDVDGKLSYRSDSAVVTNVSTLDLGEHTVLKNIIGLVTSVWNAPTDSDGTPFGLGNHYLQKILGGGIVDGSNGEHYREISEELQLQGTALSDRLNYTAGFYFSDERRRFHNLEPFFDILFGGQTQINSYILSDRSYAVYAQGTYKLNASGLAITGGLRYTIDEPHKQILADDSFRAANPMAAPAGYSYDQSSRYNKLSYQLGIQDQVSSNLLLYAVTRRAYKAGGYNGTVAPKVGSAQVAGDSYGAEKVSDVEVGVKFQGRVAGVPARLTLAGFNYWNENSQRLAFTLANGNPASLTVNIPKGTTYGVEFEGQIAPAPWLSLGAVLNYTHATYSATPVLVNGDSQIYDQVPDTPRASGSLFADITAPVTGNLSVLLHGDVYHQSTSYTTSRSAINDGATIFGYTIANFRVGVEDRRAHWTLTANLKNAFNKVYYTGGLATGEIFQLNVLVPAEPRTFSVDARFKF